MDQNVIPWSGGYRDLKPASEIFIVDDDQDMRDVLAATLEPEGFPVTSFEDGESFLKAASTRVPICVFLDVVMPKRSGLEILKELRARQYCAPIVLISARDDAPMIVEAMKNGAHDYISKPFDRFAPARRVRDAVEVWSCRAQERTALELRPVEDGEWFLLTPGERDMLALMRMMNGPAR
jgi:two-component system, LuxR family, response regulator FixJ